MPPVDWKVTEDGERWFKFNSRFDSFKYFYGHWLSIILFIIVIISIILVGSYIYKNKVAFFENPLTYGIKQIEEKSEGSISCSCFMTREDFPSTSFVLDREGMHKSES